MRHLIVALPSPSHGAPAAAPAGAGTELEFVLASNGTAADHGRAAPAVLPSPQGAGAEVVAVLPPDALSWHAVALPKGVGLSSPRLRAVLDGLLEDRLLDEPAQLHLAAFARAGAANEVWVAACPRDWLRGWCAALEAAQRPVDRIVPELPPAESGVVLQLSGNADAPQAALCDADGVWVGPLSALLTRPEWAAAPPPDLRIRSEPATAAAAERLGRGAVEVANRSQWLAQVAATPAAQWNLAQGEFDASGGRRALRNAGKRAAQALWAPQWRAARWGAAAVLLAHLAGLNAWAWHEQRALTAKRESIEQLLVTTFPQVKVVVDAPLQMERETAALRRASGAASQADLESLLGALAQTLPTAAPPAQIEFADGELRLRGVALSTADLPAAREQARARGVRLDLQGDLLVLSTRSAP